MAQFDLAELDDVVGRGNVLSDHRWASVSFPRNAHLQDQQGSLTERVQSLILERTGSSCRGPIRLVTQLRYFGHYFSPLNLFLVFPDETSHVPQYILAEVNNIPWGEQQVYLLQPQWDDAQQAWTCQHAKQMHVSPFMPMDHTYRWTFRSFDEPLDVRLENWQGDRRVFHAGMQLEKRPLARSVLRRFMWRMPAMSLKVVAAIYLEAWKLWWKRCPIYPHPRKLETSRLPARASEAL